MLKVLAQFFSTLAGTHDHAGITHTEHEQLKKALEANKTIVTQQLQSLKDKDAEIEARTKEKTHLVQQLEKAVKASDTVVLDLVTKEAELVKIKDALREAQNNKVATLEVRQVNAQLRKELSELQDEQAQAITMLNSFAVEMRKN